MSKSLLTVIRGRRAPRLPPSPACTRPRVADVVGCAGSPCSAKQTAARRPPRVSRGDGEPVRRGVVVVARVGAARRPHAAADAGRAGGPAAPARPGQPAAAPDRPGAGRRPGTDERDPLGAAGHRQDHARLAREHRRPDGGSSSSRRSPPGSRTCARSSSGPATRSGCTGTGTVLFVDEVHRFSKTQQDALLPAVENGWVTLVAATTENPSFSVISPAALALAGAHARLAVRRRHPRPARPRGRPTRAGSTARSTLSEAVEDTCCASRAATRAGRSPASRRRPVRRWTWGTPRSTSPRWSGRWTHAAPRYDRDGDQHYDVISAFIK